MYARVTTFREPVDDAIRVKREQVVPVVLDLPGNRGGFFLVNRDEAETLSLTLWESREALDASAGHIERLRGERTRDVPGSELLELEEYEVVLAPPWAEVFRLVVDYASRSAARAGGWLRGLLRKSLVFAGPFL